MKKWIVLFFISSLIAGCSQGGAKEDYKGASPENDMNHDMSGMEGMMNDHMNHDSPLPLKDSKGLNELPIPPLLQKSTTENVDYTLTAQKGKRMLLEGQETETYGYNGDFLGPVLKLRKVESVRIKTVNELDEDTTFHWHGLDVPGDVDGVPIIP